MGYMDQLCSMCQAGVPHDCSPPADPPEDVRHCLDCGEPFNIRSAIINARICPTCARRAGQNW